MRDTCGTPARLRHANLHECDANAAVAAGSQVRAADREAETLPRREQVARQWLAHMKSSSDMAARPAPPNVRATAEPAQAETALLGPLGGKRFWQCLVQWSLTIASAAEIIIAAHRRFLESPVSGEPGAAAIERHRACRDAV